MIQVGSKQRNIHYFMSTFKVTVYRMGLPGSKVYEIV